MTQSRTLTMRMFHKEELFFVTKGRIVGTALKADAETLTEIQFSHQKAALRKDFIVPASGMLKLFMTFYDSMFFLSSLSEEVLLVYSVSLFRSVYIALIFVLGFV